LSNLQTSRGIVTRDLTRVFRIRSTSGEGAKAFRKDLVAVDHLNLDIQPGELFGLLGRNGAGKTTTIRVLSTLIEPTSGHASVAGFDVTRQPTAVRASIGCVLPGERNHYWKLTARENLRFFAAMYGVDPRREKARISEVLEIVSLSDRADERVENYSTGMRQRLALARALLHNPPVLFLDEPTGGLDVHSARSLRSLVKDLASLGHTVLLTTHNLQEAQDLCTRVAIIHKGKLVAVDSPDGLRKRSSAADIVGIRCRLPGSGTPYESAAAAVYEDARPEMSPVPLIRTLLGDSGISVEGVANAGDWAVTCKGPRAASYIPRLTAALFEHGWEMVECAVKQPNLEDIFVEITADEEETTDE
jgi:ABC-2 type transport system ATP-binding protein